MIHVAALCKNFGDLEALKDVSFDAAAGQVVGVLGLNGAGKSTLLRVLAGELAPTSGTVRVGELDLAERPREIRAQVGYLPETAPLYRDMRVRDFLRFIGRLNGASRAGLEARIAEVAETTHITAELGRVIGELSLGFRKRVGIAQAILHDPAVVILDEPVTALDPAEIVGMRALVRSLGGRHTVLVSSHILSEVHETCDRILVLDRGAIKATGTEAELSARFAGTTRLEVVARGAEDTLRAALPEGARAVAVTPAGDGLLRESLELEDEQREALVAALVAAGLGVRAVREVVTDLEGLFLSMVQDEARRVGA